MSIYEAPYDRWRKSVDETYVKMKSCEHVVWYQHNDRWDRCLNCGLQRETTE